LIDKAALFDLVEDTPVDGALRETTLFMRTALSEKSNYTDARTQKPICWNFLSDSLGFGPLPRPYLNLSSGLKRARKSKCKRTARLRADKDSLMRNRWIESFRLKRLAPLGAINLSVLSKGSEPKRLRALKSAGVLHSKQAHRVPAENLFLIDVRHTYHLFYHLYGAFLPSR
jgi:hypothetical protein